MTWEIRLPYKTKADSMVDLGSNARHLEPEEADVIRRLALNAAVGGVKTVGELLGWLDAFKPDERRYLLDTLRTRLGMKSATQLDQEKRTKEETPVSYAVHAEHQPVQTCAADGCDAYPIDPTVLIPRHADVRKWWCDQHADQAAPGDMEPAGPNLRFAKSGGLEAIPPADGIIRAPSTGAGWTPVT